MTPRADHAPGNRWPAGPPADGLVRMASWDILDPAWATRLLDEHAPDWFALDDDPAADRVKHNALRSVYRATVGDRVVFVKVYDQSKVADVARRLVRGDPARREVASAAYAARHGVPCVRFVGWGRGRDASIRHRSVSVSPVVENQGTLAEVFATRDAAGARAGQLTDTALIDACAKLLAAAHDGGFLHPDNHAGNILVQTCDQTPRCLYVDVYGARCGVAVSERDVAANLAPLAHWLSRRCTRSQVYRGLVRYARYRDDWAGRSARKRLARMILSRARRHAHRLYRKRDRRIGRRNAYFARLDLHDNWRAWITLRYRTVTGRSARSGETGCSDVHLARLGERFLARDAGARHPVLVDGPDTERFFPAGLLESLCWRWTSPPWRRYRGSLWVMNRDLPVVAGWAYLEQRDGGRVSQAAWIRTAYSGGQPLGDWLTDHTGGTAHRRLLEKIGRLLADTFERGLIPRNLARLPVAVVSGQDGSPQPIWSGVEVARVAKPAGASARRFALAPAAAEAAVLSRLSLARIARAYCRAATTGKAPRSAWRELMRLGDHQLDEPDS